MILAVLALVMTSFSLAPVASADEIGTSTTTSPTTTTPSAKPPATTTPSSTAEAPTSEKPATTEPTTTAEPPTSEAPTSEKPTTTTTEPTTTTPTTAKRLAARGVNPDIDVKITDIQVEGKNDQQITVGDSVTVKGTWDATNATPQPGDQFTIKFPDELKLQANPKINLVGTDNTLWGTCELVATTNLMTCTLSDAVAERPDEVKGDFFVYTKAVEYTTEENVDFTINGKYDVTHELPGGGGIGDGHVIGEATKSGQLQDNKQSVRWTIDIPGADLAKLDAGGTGSVTLSDALSSNMKLCEGSRLDAKMLSGRPGDLKNVPGGVTITQPAAGDPVSININNGGTFQKDKLYRVEYTSCTTSGEVDPKGTLYTNAVMIGDKTVGSEGVGQDFAPQTGPSKSGGWAGGTRYNEIDWSITIPGTFIADLPDQKVIIGETLSANHEVCATGLKPEIWRANRLPGLNGETTEPEDVTSEFNIDASAATAGSQSFSMTITPKTKIDKDSKQYYFVKFRTCLGDKKVPDSTNKFTNTAVVNAKSTNASVTGPTFEGGKSGTLNTEPKNVAGAMQPAGTTIDWKVQVSGHTLEGLAAPAVITDTFSGSLAVCEVSGDLKKDLNLKVVAKDFLNDGNVHPKRDLTKDATVTRSGDNGIAITLPKQADDYNRETRYFIDYTLCTSSGGLDERGTVYGNSVFYNGTTQTSSVRQEWGGGGTGQGVSRGSFSLLKQIDSSSEKFPEGTEFTVKVEEFAPGQNPATDAPYSAYNIRVKADGTPVSGVNARGTGWQIRLSEIDLPTVDGVYFEPGKFRPAEGVVLNADSTQALVTITPKSNVAVKLVNKAVLGSVKITKTVIGDGIGGLTGTEAFVINAEITHGDNNAAAESRQFTLKDGQFYELKALPIGAKVTFTEVKPANTDHVTWSEPVITPKTLTIGADASQSTVSVTNEAKITQGTFEVSKKLTGPQASNGVVPKTFDVIASWTDADNTPQSKTLTLPADGTPVRFGQNLPGGTKVTLTETVPADGNGLAYGDPAFSGNVTIGDDGAAVVTIGKDPGTVQVTNYVDKNDGTLRILKQVSGEAADAISNNVEFTVEARWKDGADYRTKVLTVKKGVATPLGVDLPVGTEVTFTETGRTDVAGVEWGTISWGTSPSGESWLITGADGTATGIVSDNPADGRLITLTNEALWKFGSVEFTKFILDGDNPVPATDSDLPAGAEFQVRIDNIDPPLPAGTDFPAVGETITLNAGNGFSWTSGEVLPRDTVVTFSEVDPNPLPGIDWARPYYWVAEDAGDADFRNTVGIVPGDKAVVEIRNRIIPTTNVDIDKIVTGPKGGQVMKDPSTTFQITATWTDVDDAARSCILDVKPGASVTPTAKCDAAVLDGKVQFPLDTEITFVETGAHTDVTNVQWGEVKWSVKKGSADIAKIDGQPTGVTVILTGDANGSVVLGLENVTSSKGLIIIPIPIPLPPFGGGSLIPPFPGPGPGVPVDNPGPDAPGDSGHNGAPGKPAPAKPNQSPSLPVTGANVIWLTGGALALIAAGAWLTLRNRRKLTGEE
ncbi:peptidase [Rhodococcus sp. SRB_17]|nr:peptidase [Rhodococcus sp. SRB_17]